MSNDTEENVCTSCFLQKCESCRKMVYETAIVITDSGTRTDAI